MARRFSWKRAAGITGAKRSIAKATGIPTTRSGRKCKVGRMLGLSRSRRVGCLVALVLAGLAAAAVAAAIGAEAPQPPALSPPPSGAELARAEKDAADIFGGEVEAARKPADKAAVAGKMLTTARKLDDDPAGRYVLAVQARDLAVGAGDAKRAVKAAEVLAGYQPANGANSAKEWAARGHELWTEGERLRGQEQLAKRAEAAEWYLRALGGLEGLERKLADKRLGELGWDPVGQDYIPLEELSKRLDFAGYKWEKIGDRLSCEVGNYDRGKSGVVLTKDAVGGQSLEFGFKMRAQHYQMIVVEVDGLPYAYSRGHWQNEGAMAHDGTIGREAFHKRPGPKVEDPQKWYCLSASVGVGTLRFFYEGEQVWEKQLPTPTGPTRRFRIGFGSHRTTVEVKDFYVKAR